MTALGFLGALLAIVLTGTALAALHDLIAHLLRR